MKKQIVFLAVALSLFFGMGQLPLSFAGEEGKEQEDREEQEEKELVIPLKTRYAPQEREAILGFDIAHSGEAETWITSLELAVS